MEASLVYRSTVSKNQINKNPHCRQAGRQTEHVRVGGHGCLWDDTLRTMGGA